jgi:hypothetical protein
VQIGPLVEQPRVCSFKTTHPTSPPPTQICSQHNSIVLRTVSLRRLTLTIPFLRFLNWRAGYFFFIFVKLKHRICAIGSQVILNWFVFFENPILVLKFLTFYQFAKKSSDPVDVTSDKWTRHLVSTWMFRCGTMRRQKSCLGSCVDVERTKENYSIEPHCRHTQQLCMEVHKE